MCDSITLAAALHYADLGWSVIPIRQARKVPACKCWKVYQQDAARHDKLRRWFRGTSNGIAIIFGRVSRGLACRDFDQKGAYEHWAGRHPPLAKVLPTVKTGRGHHVYFRLDDSGSFGIRKLQDGELRASGCYCVAPPSIHPSGHHYHWLIEPTTNIPILGPAEADLLPCATESDRENRCATEAILGRRIVTATQMSGGVPNPEIELTPEIERVLLESLPAGPGQRNRQVFELARALKRVPHIADAPARALKPLVKCWHQFAFPATSGVHTWDDTWCDFLTSWPKVKYPKGAEPMVQIVEAAFSMELPDEALEFERDEVRRLICLCRELQRAAGPGRAFYLGCRTAGKYLDVDFSTASRWLYMLCQECILAEVTKGNNGTRKASRYRYLLPL